jgi:predicted Zn-dependent protease
MARVAAVVAGVATLAALVAGVTDVHADRRAADAADALSQGDHRAAARAALDAADERPDVVRLHVLAAAAVVADEQGALAGIRELDRALDISPGDPIVQLARVRLLVDRAEATHVPAHLDAARAELDRLLRRDPNNAALWRERVRVARLAGDDERARRATDRADELTPSDQAAP